MRALRHPQEAAQMRFIWGNIYATPLATITPSYATEIGNVLV